MGGSFSSVLSAEKSVQATSGTKSNQNSESVRLNVGGKVFQTTKDTFSRYPDSWLARLVDGDNASDKDESGAYFIDGDPEHFRTILSYLRTGVLNLDGNQKTSRDLLREAYYYEFQSLVDEIHNAMGTVFEPNGTVKRYEIIIVKQLEQPMVFRCDNCHYTALYLSEKRDDYEVLQALRQKMEITSNFGVYYVRDSFEANWESIEAVLRSYGFVRDKFSYNCELSASKKDSWKFVRSV
ncbi:BTB/POZ domain-containing protein [Ditylenchus destructor]|uniref:BTB/POZ domain-containing protein n=1 Tax=Ditylenchus destructor TaxID=166010 RepID=A0AAD4QWP1_9BILA|nr:BTB/POZ domain-containing protein [Ditylenchus destructor]